MRKSFWALFYVCLAYLFSRIVMLLVLPWHESLQIVLSLLIIPIIFTELSARYLLKLKMVRSVSLEVMRLGIMAFLVVVFLDSMLMYGLIPPAWYQGTSNAVFYESELYWLQMALIATGIYLSGRSFQKVEKATWSVANRGNKFLPLN